MNNLFKRFLVAIIGIPITIVVLWYGGVVFGLAVIVVTSVALWEFYRLAESKDASANQTVGIIWSVIFQGSVVMATISKFFDGLVWFGVAILIFVSGVVLTLMAELWRGRRNALVNTGLTIAGVSYVTVCMTTLIFLREIDSPIVSSSFAEGGGALVLTLFVSVWMCDIAAYFIGVRFGKHKLFPRVSPKKSWEGAIAGGIASVIAFIAMSAWLMKSFPIEHAIAGGAIIGSLGQIGDLAESLLKRDATIKDSSRILPGHGGVLDRFDSMLFASPLLFIYLSVVRMLT
ncbi:MAG: phosphatidate cytidylyltransferase [Ignavibacteria bacterium]|nr:phosphatidate cytidylyltransferase [Ignavibacteria bacterium]